MKQPTDFVSVDPELEGLHFDVCQNSQQIVLRIEEALKEINHKRQELQSALGAQRRKTQQADELLQSAQSKHDNYLNRLNINLRGIKEHSEVENLVYGTGSTIYVYTRELVCVPPAETLRLGRFRIDISPQTSDVQNIIRVYNLSKSGKLNGHYLSAPLFSADGKCRISLPSKLVENARSLELLKVLEETLSLIQKATDIPEFAEGLQSFRA